MTDILPSLFLLALVVLGPILAWRAVRRADAQRVPCTACGALLHPDALSCKHCGRAAELPQPEWWCPHCETLGTPVEHKRGSVVVTLLLCLLWLLPGVVYGVWRHSTKQLVCPSCKAPNMLPRSSPRARVALAQGAR